MKTWTDTGALVRLQGPYVAKRSTLREWVLLAIALGALCLSGCACVYDSVGASLDAFEAPAAAPMSEYNCAGWRTLADGRNECIAIERTVR